MFHNKISIWSRGGIKEGIVVAKIYYPETGATIGKKL